MNYKTTIGAIAAALALYASAGCNKDEPIVVHPRVSCCHRNCDNDSNTRVIVVKPEYNPGVKQNYTRPQLSKHNPFDDPDARERAERLINARRGTQYVIPLPPGYRATTVVPGGPVITTRFRIVESGPISSKPNGNTAQRGSSSGSASQRSQELMPNPYTECNSGSTGSSAETGTPRSLEQRLRDCERQNEELRQLNSELEQQLDDAMTPDHGRG